jgi:hypothetical protein
MLIFLLVIFLYLFTGVITGTISDILDPPNEAERITVFLFCIFLWPLGIFIGVPYLIGIGIKKLAFKYLEFLDKARNGGNTQ